MKKITLKEREQEYKKRQDEWKAKIRKEPSKWKRFWKWIWYFTAFPFVWLWENIHDWKTFVVFLFCFILLTSEIWVPYLIALIVGVETNVGITLISVASACWLFWIGPGTPFLIICIGLTMFCKAMLDKILNRRNKKKAKVSEPSNTVSDDKKSEEIKPTIEKNNEENKDGQ